MMTSRERVLTTMDHKEPDRVPICFGNHSTYSIIEGKPYGYKALCNYLKVKYKKPQAGSFALTGNVDNVDKKIRDKLHVDFEFITCGAPKNEELPNGHLKNPMFHGAIMVPTSDNIYTFAREILAPFRWGKDPGDIDKYEYWTDFSDQIYYDGVREKAKTFQEKTDKAVIADDIPVTFGHNYAFLVGFDRWLTDMKIRPDFYHAIMEKLYEKNETFTKRYLTEVGDYIDILLTGDDMGSQDGPLMGIKNFKEFIAPYWRRWVNLARKYTKAKLIIHSCGSVYKLYSEFIKIGWDAHEAVQITAKDMTPVKIKKKFGDKITFFGALDHQKTLPRESVAGVRKFVRKLIQELGQGGGFIFGPMHSLGPEIPPENIVAAFDEAYRFGRYPLS